MEEEEERRRGFLYEYFWVWNGLGELPLFPMVKIALGYEHLFRTNYAC